MSIRKISKVTVVRLDILLYVSLVNVVGYLVTSPTYCRRSHGSYRRYDHRPLSPLLRRSHPLLCLVRVTPRENRGVQEWKSLDLPSRTSVPSSRYEVCHTKVHSSRKKVERYESCLYLPVMSGSSDWTGQSTNQNVGSYFIHFCHTLPSTACSHPLKPSQSIQPFLPYLIGSFTLRRKYSWLSHRTSTRRKRNVSREQSVLQSGGGV